MNLRRAAARGLLSGLLCRWSASLAYGDRHDAAVIGAEGPLVRVVGKSDARGPQLVDQGRRLPRGSDLHGADGWRLIAAEKDGYCGQVRQDLSLTDVGVSRPT